MKKEVLKCPKCKTYTFKDTCPSCSTTTTTPKPARYSPLDKWGKYRRIEKKSKNL